MDSIRQMMRRGGGFRCPERYAVRHAPAGGVSVAGEEFAGGEFIPAGVMARATPSERAAIEGPERLGRPKGGKAAAKQFAKPRAVRGKMLKARRIGKGKEAKIILGDGSQAPPFIKPSMIPPVWENVRVAVDPKADVLVIAKGHIVYNDEYAAKTAAIKYARVRAVIEQFPVIERQIQEARRSANPALREAADCAWLIAEQATRPGSEKQTGRVKAYGATTLRAEHVVVDGKETRLRFVGKEVVHHDHLIRNPELVAMLRARAATANQRDWRLFLTDEKRLNAFLRRTDGGFFTAKDLRTRKATLIANQAVAEYGAPPATAKEYKKAILAVAEKAAHVLGNKPKQCLDSYIDNTVFSAWLANL